MTHLYNFQAGLPASSTVLLSLPDLRGSWRLILALVWCGCMLLDYLSGTAAAAKSGSWSSTRARQGLWHKGGMILVVAVAAIADAVLGGLVQFLPGLLDLSGLSGVSGVSGLSGASGTAWPGLLLPLVLGWYIVTELGSVLENALLLGAPVPDWLRKLLQVTLRELDAAGEQAAGIQTTGELSAGTQIAAEHPAGTQTAGEQAAGAQAAGQTEASAGAPASEPEPESCASDPQHTDSTQDIV